MNQSLFVNFHEHSAQDLNHSNTGDDPESAKRIHNEVLEHRLAEMESREEILDHLRAIHKDRLWKVLGYKSLQAFCKKELGYTARESREISISLGAILVAHGLKAPDDETQLRIDVLRNWRRKKAFAENVAAYRIFTNRTLMQLAHENPESPKRLSEISGLGSRRLKSFGEEILQVLRTAPSQPYYQPSIPSTDA